MTTVDEYLRAHGRHVRMIRRGWTTIERATKRHYFTIEERISLCGKWALLRLPNDLDDGNDTRPDNCALCRSRLQRRRTGHAAKGRLRKLSPEQASECVRRVALYESAKRIARENSMHALARQFGVSPCTIRETVKRYRARGEQQCA